MVSVVRRRGYQSPKHTGVPGVVGGWGPPVGCGAWVICVYAWWACGVVMRKGWLGQLAALPVG